MHVLLAAAAPYAAAPAFVNSGDTAWQLTSATLVGIMSIPAVAMLYAGLVKKKWALNSAVMVFYAFAAVLVTWVLFGYNLSFGQPWNAWQFIGIPGPALSPAAELGQATIPLAAPSMPALRFSGATMVYFQFVFAAIAPILVAGSVLGRMNFKAWMLFVPLWSTLVYSIGCFSLWGGGWLTSLGAIDYSGGYVIHLAAGVSGFVAAAVVGPRLASDKRDFSPNNMIMALAGAGLLWLGWNGFNGGDPFAASADASAAVLNTNISTAVALLVWMIADYIVLKHISAVSMINGTIAGLVAITPCAGWVSGYGAILVGMATIVPWLSITFLSRWSVLKKVDDTFSVLHTHGVAGLVGGLMAGLVADPQMVEWLGTNAKTPAIAYTGALFGNTHLLLVQLAAAAFIVALNVVGTFAILKAISLVVPLRSSEDVMQTGDLAIHGMDPIPGVASPIRADTAA